MTIEAQLERIATALEKLAAGSAGQAPASSSSTKPAPSEKKSSSKSSPKSSAPESADESASTGPSKDDVRAALKSLQKSKGPMAARKLLEDHGAKTLTDLAEGKYAAVIAAAQE